MMGLFLGWQILTILKEIAVGQQHLLAEISKIRFGETALSGGIVQRFLQICDKITFVERRLMEMMARKREVLRILQTEIFSEHWRSWESGFKQINNTVMGFVGWKFRLGAKKISGEWYRILNEGDRRNHRQGDPAGGE
jgi:hypothetical protein